MNITDHFKFGVWFRSLYHEISLDHFKFDVWFRTFSRDHCFTKYYFFALLALETLLKRN
jgi:hypothetical protein